MKREENMDALARDLLRDESVTPPDSVWDKLEAQLPATRERNKPVFYPWLTAGGLLLLLLGFGAGYWWYSITSQREAVPGPNAQTTAALADTASIAPAGTDTLRKPEAHPLRGDGAPVKAATPSAASEPVADSTPKAEGAASPVESPVESMSSDARGFLTGRAAPAANAGWLADRKGRDTAGHTPGTEASAFSPLDFSESPVGPLRVSGVDDPVLMSPLVSAAFAVDPKPQLISRDEDYGPGPRAGWVIGVFADIRNTSLRINQVRKGSEGVIDSLSAAEKASSNAGIGITVGYHLSPKWRIGSGIAFAKWCRTTSYPVLLSVPEPFQEITTSSEQSIPLEQHIVSATGTQSLTATVSSDALAATITNGFAQSGFPEQVAIEECYQFLQVPIFLEYVYSARRLSILPGAGITYEHALKRTSRFAPESDLLPQAVLAQPEGYRKHFLSFAAGLHVEYMLTTRLSVRAGANYKAWLTPVYSSDLLETYPRLMSVDAGIIYTFNRRRL